MCQALVDILEDERQEGWKKGFKEGWEKGKKAAHEKMLQAGKIIDLDDAVLIHMLMQVDGISKAEAEEILRFIQ